MTNKTRPIYYADYLQLDRVLSSQKLESEKHGPAAHDEMLFIIVHQVYELWFKEILHELDAVLHMFKIDYVDERTIGVAVSRLNRIIEIEKLLIDQIRVIETITPLDFLDFRNYLGVTSGFQSAQFRMIENKLGLRPEQRLVYNERSYTADHKLPDQERLAQAVTQGTLFTLVESWLERIPFLEFEGFHFLQAFEKAVAKMLDTERNLFEKNPDLSPREKQVRLAMWEADQSNFKVVLDENRYNGLRNESKRRLSYRANLSALFINLYRDEPILHMPYRFLAALLDVDEHFTLWRYHHSAMVLRMIGTRFGTGGSSGHDYLLGTVEKHKIFTDLFNLSSLMIPRSGLPDLPDGFKQNLGFYYTCK